MSWHITRDREVADVRAADVEYHRLEDAQKQLAVIVGTQERINGRRVEYGTEGQVRLYDGRQYLCTFTIVDEQGQVAPCGL